MIPVKIRDQIELQDIFLYDAHFTQDFKAQGLLKQQSRTGVHSTFVDCVDGKMSAQVIVDLGIRLVNAKELLRCEVAARFLLIYQFTQDLTQEQREALGELSVHTAWPFWRQHVFDVVQRSRLPHISVPLFGDLGKKRVGRKAARKL